MGTASSKNKVAAGTPQPAPAAPPPTAAPAEDDIVITTRAVRGESKVAPAPHDGAKHVQSSRSFGTAASTPGRLKRRRMVSIQNDEELVGALKALSEIEDSLREQGFADEHSDRLETLRVFLTSKALRNMVLQRNEMTKLKNQYRELRRKSDDGHELATYVEQFGVPGEERGRRRSVTLGAAIMAGRVAKRIKSNIMEVANKARSTESLVIRVCGLSSSELEELAAAQGDLNRWGFDVLRFNKLVNGNALLAAGIFLFAMHELPKSVAINQGTLCGFLQAIQSGYERCNPYHNAIHAADVMQTTSVFLVSHLIESLNLRPLEVFSMLIAAAVHDFKHPGVNNNFLIKTQAPLATIYNDMSVLENMHCAEAFKLCRADQRRNIFKDMAKDSSEAARKLIIAAVLGTDMAHHFQKLTEFNASVVVEANATARRESVRADNGEAPVEVLVLEPEQRTLALCIALHAADVSNPVKPLEVYKEWAYRVMDEFFSQGDQEVSAGIGISPFMDRHNPQAVTCQTGFINFIVKPLFVSFQAVVPSLRQAIEGNLARNQAWLAEPECMKDLPLLPDPQRYSDDLHSSRMDAGSGPIPEAHASSERASGPVLGAVVASPDGAGGNGDDDDGGDDDTDELPAAAYTTPRPVFSAPGSVMTLAGVEPGV